jgi:hypothetical protein
MMRVCLKSSPSSRPSAYRLIGKIGCHHSVQMSFVATLISSKITFFKDRTEYGLAYIAY